MMRDSINANFNVKQVKFGICKVYAEFVKHLEHDLPFIITLLSTYVFIKDLCQSFINHQQQNQRSRGSKEESS